MINYISTFCISVFLFKASEKVKKKQRFALEFLAIFILCLLAGLRADSVGTDTSVYLRPCIEAAIRSDSYQDYLSSAWIIGGWRRAIVSDYEIGFVLSVFIFAKLFGSVAIVQFVIQLLILLPVYTVIKRTKDIPRWLGMFVYLLLFYNLSFNLIRQSIAMSFILLAVHLWAEGARKKCFIFLLIGFSFHSSGLIGIGVILLYEFVQKNRKHTLKIMRIRIDARYANMVIVILTGIAIIIFANILAVILQSTPFAGYAGYISGDLRFMPNQIIKLLPPFLILLYNFDYLEQKTKQAKFYVTLLILSIILLQFTSVNEFGGRIVEYFLYFAIISFPSACRNGKKLYISKFSMIAYLIFYWFFYYGYGNIGETVPYQMISF